MIYIVRHDKTDWNIEGRIQGHTDIELNDIGRKQAKEVKEKLKNIKFDLVFSSPLKRTLETARIITDHDIIIDERLIERCNGILEGKKKSEIGNIDYNDPSNNIESTEHLQERVDSFFNEIMDKYKDKNILIVTHGGVSINIRIFFEGPPKDGDIGKYKLDNCKVLVYKN